MLDFSDYSEETYETKALQIDVIASKINSQITFKISKRYEVKMIIFFKSFLGAKLRKVCNGRKNFGILFFWLMKVQIEALKLQIKTKLECFKI